MCHVNCEYFFFVTKSQILEVSNGFWKLFLSNHGENKKNFFFWDFLYLEMFEALRNRNPTSYKLRVGSKIN